MAPVSLTPNQYVSGLSFSVKSLRDLTSIRGICVVVILVATAEILRRITLIAFEKIKKGNDETKIERSDDHQKSAISTIAANTATIEKVCTICQDTINAEPNGEEEEKILPCAHPFHKACIEQWLIQKHSCPNCNAHVDGVTTREEARTTPEMTLEEILAVPDNLQPYIVTQILDNLVPVVFADGDLRFLQIRDIIQIDHRTNTIVNHIRLLVSAR